MPGRAPEIPQPFLERFVLEPMRRRVEHEWRKKPDKLHSRICHAASDLFDARFLTGEASFESDEEVFVLAGGHPVSLKYSEAEAELGSGSGVLIVAASGEKFVAETESTKGTPFVVYAAS